MKIVTQAILLFLFITLLSIEALGKEWRGIVPLHSTRADVKRILGTPITEWDWAAYFSLPEGIVLVEYQVGKCDEDLGPLGFGWNVPQGTVTSIGIIPKKGVKKDVLMRGGDFQSESGAAGIVYYIDSANGVSIETYRNRVTLIEYRPEKSRSPLHCRQIRSCCSDFWAKFDAYGDISFTDEKARLDNYSIQITNALRRGVIVVYGETPTARRKRAERAKSYLIRERGLEPHRLLIIDGGYRESLLVELQLHGIGGEVPRINVEVQKDPARNSRKKQ